MTEAAPLRIFVNGQALRGGELHHALAAATFLGPATTAPGYRFFSVRDEFPGLLFAPDDAAAAESGIDGELYGVGYDVLRDVFLPGEPAELELGVIKLADGSGSLSMVMRTAALELPGVQEITAHRGWRAYRGLAVPD